VEEAKQQKPQHAAVMNVRGIGGSALMGEPVDQEVDAGAESHRKNGAHFAVSENCGEAPSEEIQAGSAAGRYGICHKRDPAARTRRCS